jgi:DNA repair protein RecO (recombination protein O)
MNRTYKATGINLKGVPLGESDRLLTILTREFGLIRVVAPSARKYNSKLGGRSGLFVVNQLLISKGRSLDKISQAETLESYPGLGKDLGKLAASQYLAELVLCHALSDQPQEELYGLLKEHLNRLEKSPNDQAIAHLTHAIFHLLVLAGIAPQVQLCCVTKEAIAPNFHNPNWRVGFSISGGGIVNLQPQTPPKTNIQKHPTPDDENFYQQELPTLNAKLNAPELEICQQLAKTKLPDFLDSSVKQVDLKAAWLSVERILRQYAQYHFGRSIRSAALIDAYFSR